MLGLQGWGRMLARMDVDARFYLVDIMLLLCTQFISIYVTKGAIQKFKVWTFKAFSHLRCNL